MTEQELTTIEARAAAATAGPWRTVFDDTSPAPCVDTSFGIRPDTVARVNIRVGRPAPMGAAEHEVALDQAWATMAFIAHAREDVPGLVAEVRRLRAVLARLVACIDTSAADDGPPSTRGSMMAEVCRVLQRTAQVAEAREVLG